MGNMEEVIAALFWKTGELAPCVAVGDNSPHRMWQSGGRICHFNLVNRDFFKNNSLNS